MAWNEAFKRLYPASADLLRNGISRQELRKAMLERGDAPTDDGRSSDWIRSASGIACCRMAASSASTAWRRRKAAGSCCRAT